MEAITFQDIVDKGWKHDPPKAISDVMESILGAVLVDSAWNFDVAATVTEFRVKRRARSVDSHFAKRSRLRSDDMDFMFRMQKDHVPVSIFRVACWIDG